MSNSSHQIPDKAESISVTPSGNLTSTDVQNALQELQTDIDGLGGGNYVVLNVVDLTSSPTALVSWDNTLINSSYKTYEIYGIGLKNSNGSTYGQIARVTESGTPASGASDYKQASTWITSTPSTSNGGGSVDAAYLYASTVNSNKSNNFKIELCNSQQSSETEINIDVRYDTTSQQEKLTASISRQSPVISDGIQISTTTGTYNAGFMVLVGKN